MQQGSGGLQSQLLAAICVWVAGDEPRGTSGEAPELAIWGTVARASQLSPSHPRAVSGTSEAKCL